MRIETHVASELGQVQLPEDAHTFQLLHMRSFVRNKVNPPLRSLIKERENKIQFGSVLKEYMVPCLSRLFGDLHIECAD